MRITSPVMTYTALGHYGRLGNQLFEIASTIGIAEKNSSQWMFPKWNYSKYLNEPLPVLPQDVPIHAMFQEEHPIHYSDVKIESNQHLVYDIKGHRQNIDYFKHCEDLIRSVFEPKQSVVDSITRKFPSLYSKTSCFVHIRRGDYVNLSHLYINLYDTTNYYNTALMLYPGLKEIIFLSDDIDWCKTTIPEHPNVKYKFSETKNDFEDLILLSMARNVIISNSTFAWWGAWLNESPGHNITCPKLWFTDSLGGLESSKTFHMNGWNIV